MSPKVELLSAETIRPSSPTPSHLRTYRLSQWDQFIPPEMYGTFVFFYGSDFDVNKNADSLAKFFDKSRLLKVALSKTLVDYYPLAGRLTNGGNAIDCNDEGAQFVEARFGDNLLSFLKRPDHANLLSPFIPEVDAFSVSKAILLVQLTLFSCGGMAVTIYISHRLADAFSVFTILQSWISMIHGEEKSFKPIFLESSSSPPEDLPLPDSEVDFHGEFVMNRFVFSVPKIEALKAKLRETYLERQNPPSNVTVVLAIIMKSVTAAYKSVSGTSRPTALLQTVNMRKMASPPFPDNTIGNILWVFQAVFEEDEIEISRLIHAIRTSNITKLDGEKKVQSTEIRTIKRSNLIQSYKEKKVITTDKIKKIKNYYVASSLCKFPVYDTDFGWGKPLWAVCTPSYWRNQIILMDTREGDGIEAWICLDEKEMAIFERQKEILAFASVNPSVVVNHSRM